MTNLDPNATVFTWPNARALAARCARAYQAVTVSDPATDTGALVIDEGNCISVAFRGSRALRDWIQDFKAAEHTLDDLMWPNNGDTVKVHAGFLANVEGISEPLTHTIRNLQQAAWNRYPIIVTGHSKGAAEALLAALELERQGFLVRQVITFAGPRVGNAAWANLYNSTLFEETFRVVNQNDIVPRLPAAFKAYRHAGQEIFLPSWGGWELNPSLGSKIASDALGFWRAYRNKIDVLFSEHVIAAYEDRIQLLT